MDTVGTPRIDTVDAAIIEALRVDGRRSAHDIAHAVKLSPSAVTRRIGRLEGLGVIRGYTAVVDERYLGPAMDAFAEVRYDGQTDVQTITNSAARLPEVIAVYTVAGDPDALVHFRVSSLGHLHRLIDRIRRNPHVTNTKTLMVLDSWQRGMPLRLDEVEPPQPR